MASQTGADAMTPDESAKGSEAGMWRATYTPGTWVVLSGPSSVVIMQPAPASASRLINSIWDAVVAAASIEELAQRLAAFGLNQMPSFGVLFWHEGRMRSLVRGAIKIVDLGSGAVIADGDGIQTWAETGLDDVRQVRVDMEPVDQDRLLQLPLVVGAVTASAIVVDATDDVRVRSPQRGDREPVVRETEAAPVGDGRPRTPAVAATPIVGAFGSGAPGRTEPQSQPDIIGVRPDVRFHVRADELRASSMSTPPPAPPPIGGPSSPRSPFARPGEGSPASASSPETGRTAPPPAGPADLANAPTEQLEGPAMVMAVDCPRQHPNPPDAHRCRQCGAPLSGRPRLIVRPAIATLRPSSGHPVDVDRAVLIGRAPTATQVRRAELPKMLTVPSPSHDISRNHVQVAPDGWNLFATDLHSTNGTFLIRPGQPGSESLRPGEPAAVYPGCVLDLGDGVTIVVDHPG